MYRSQKGISCIYTDSQRPWSPPVQTQSTRNGLDDMIHEITMGFFPKIFSPLCSHDPHHRSALHGANKHLQQRRELSVFSLILAAQISSKDPMYDRNRGQLSGKYFHSITEKKCKLGGWMAFQSSLICGTAEDCVLEQNVTCKSHCGIHARVRHAETRAAWGPLAAVSLGRSPVDRGEGYNHCLYVDHQICLEGKGNRLQFSFTFYFWLIFVEEFYAWSTRSLKDLGLKILLFSLNQQSLRVKIQSFLKSC